jgi:hypothetical protein
MFDVFGYFETETCIDFGKEKEGVLERPLQGGTVQRSALRKVLVQGGAQAEQGQGGRSRAGARRGEGVNTNFPSLLMGVILCP